MHVVIGVQKSPPFELVRDEMRIRGLSAAGIETCFRVDPAGIALDLGRCPEWAIPVPRVLVSHSHLDHAAGVAYHAAQRRLRNLEPAEVWVPAETLGAWTRLVAVQSELQGSPLELSLRGVVPGDEIELDRNHVVRVHDAFHSIPGRSWELKRRRRELRDDLKGEAEEAIRKRVAEGEVVSDETVESILFYSGDTDATIFDEVPEIFSAKVAMIECSFIAEDERERAVRYRHIHLDDIIRRASDFMNEVLVLTHFTRRHRREEIERALAAIPDSLRERVIPVL